MTGKTQTINRHERKRNRYCLCSSFHFSQLSVYCTIICIYSLYRARYCRSDYCCTSDLIMHFFSKVFNACNWMIFVQYEHAVCTVSRYVTFVRSAGACDLDLVVTMVASLTTLVGHQKSSWSVFCSGVDGSSCPIYMV